MPFKYKSPKHKSSQNVLKNVYEPWDFHIQGFTIFLAKKFKKILDSLIQYSNKHSKLDQY